MLSFLTFHEKLDVLIVIKSILDDSMISNKKENKSLKETKQDMNDVNLEDMIHLLIDVIFDMRKVG